MWNMKTVIVIGLVIVFAAPALPQWRSWGKYNGKVTYNQRLVREGDLVTVWLKKSSLISQVGVDCSNHKIRYMVAIKGTELITTITEWRTPQNYGEWIFKKACSSVSN
jgi:hypothetical protein